MLDDALSGHGDDLGGSHTLDQVHGVGSHPGSGEHCHALFVGGALCAGLVGYNQEGRFASVAGRADAFGGCLGGLGSAVEFVLA